MAREDNVQARLAEARAAGVEVTVNREAGSMHVRASPGLEVDVFADVLRAEHLIRALERGRL